MVDNENIRKIVIKGLRDYLGCPVIRSDQNVEPPPYPYGSFTVITPESENNGTWQEHDDGYDRKAVTQTWSITFQSDEEMEALNLASKARNWFDRIGRTYLNDNQIIVQSVGSISNRDNFLTIEYEYRKGFDVVFWLYDKVKNNVEDVGTIDEVEVEWGE